MSRIAPVEELDLLERVISEHPGGLGMEIPVALFLMPALYVIFSSARESRQA